MEKIIYLDNAATTKPMQDALNEGAIFNTTYYFNPSALYREGLNAAKQLNECRNSFSNYLGGDFDVIFTSCGSESDNTAIFSYGKHGNIVTGLGEHSAVHNPFTQLKNEGRDVRFAKLNYDGSVNVKSLLSLIDDKTTFVSIVHVNNETGAVNDVNKIAKLVKEINSRIIFHSDGVQAFMKIPFKPSQNIDLYSVSAHKINALKGVGALFKNKRVKNLKPLIYGGGQEGNLRSGTENLFGIKVFEYAFLQHLKTLNDDYQRVKLLNKQFISNLNLDNFKVISSENASPYVLCLSAVGLRGEVLQHMLEEDSVIIGTGSACSSKHRHSRMLSSIGYDDKVLDGVIRISFSNQTTAEEVEKASKLLNEKTIKLKKVMNVK